MLQGNSRARLWPMLVLTAVVGGCDDSSARTTVGVVLVTSPSGELVLSVATDGDGELSYLVTRNRDVVVEESPLGLLSTTHDLTSGVTMSSGSVRRVDESYFQPTGKRRERSYSASEVVVPLRGKNGGAAELVLRAHDDGVAFRIRLLGGGESEVTDETTGFAIPAGGRKLTRAYDGGDAVFVPTAGAYEQPPEILDVGQETETTGFAFPTLFELGGAETLYVMVTEADLDGTYCATRLHESPADNVYQIRFPDEREAKGVGEAIPRSALPLQTPWRVIAVGDLSTMVESTLVDDLSVPSRVEDDAWVTPGRAAWSWFSQGTGSPDLQSEYVDFAGEYGWDYVLVDANWDEWDDPERSVRELVAQADAVGVELLLWYNSGGPHTILPSEGPLDLMIEPNRRPEMERISEWGIAGIKVDFFNSDKQDRVQQYLGILRDAADFELLVNFHGATVPRGWQRTYPHLMTHEAVNGAEVYKFAGVQGAPTAITNVQHALLRNLVGSMDYTPVVFDAALSTVGLPYAHSLALSVVFESGIQHFADRADADPDTGYRAVFTAHPYVGDFLSTVPVAWDDTRLLSGNIDGHVVLARRSGSTWYLGGIHAAEAPATYMLDLSVLDLGANYEVTLIEQGVDPTAFERTTRSASAAESLDVTLQRDGGFVAILTPQ